MPLDRWVCLVVSVQADIKRAYLFIDDDPVPAVTRKLSGTPSQQRAWLYFGIRPPRDTGDLNMWVDEFAMSQTKIGCND